MMDNKRVSLVYGDTLLTIYRVTNFNWGHYFWGLIWGQF